MVKKYLHVQLGVSLPGNVKSEFLEKLLSAPFGWAEMCTSSFHFVKRHFEPYRITHEV